ncbi:MAG: hypothetical protein PHX38_07640 [Sulfuricella sp.]|nr:hypothetical protein [Sulfuricella sp.]
MNALIETKHLNRFLQVLGTVSREASVLAEVRKRLSQAGPIDAGWVSALAGDPQRADMVESFAAKFGRMQDTIGDKLLPLFLQLVGEKTGAAIDNLNRGERLRLVPDAARWMGMRVLRNQLVHEYMEDAAQFAAALNMANERVEDLLATYSNLWRYCADNLHLEAGQLPAEFPVPRS